MKIKVLKIDVELTGEISELEIEREDYKVLQKELNVDLFDIVSRKIGDKYYDIVCDDEGLLKSNPKISAIFNTGYTVNNPVNIGLVGNLLICGKTDNEGELTGLTYEDVHNIKKHTISLFQNGKITPVVVCSG